MRASVKTVTTRNGEEMAIMIGPGGIPPYWPNLYSTIEFRNAGKSHNSARNMLLAVAMVRQWAESIGRDFDEDLISGRFFDYSDAEAIAELLDYTAKYQDQIVLQNRAVKEAGNITLLESVRPDGRKMAEERQSTIQPADKASRVRYVANYAEWMLKRRSSIEDRRKGLDASFHQAAAEAITRLRQLAPRVRQRMDDETLEAIDLETCKIIEKAMLPGSDDNPFSTPFIRLRNYLIWRLFLDTGCRIDELYNLRVDDIVFAERQMTLRISKTRPRTVKFGKHAAAAFDALISEYWSNLPKRARQRGWLFTTTSGNRLSKQMISTVFQTIRKNVREAPKWLTSHTMRRTWNERFSLMVDKQIEAGERITPDQEKAMRNRLMGWSDNSEMGGLYNRRHTRRKADEIAENLLNDIGPVTPTEADTEE